jgi:hypothetical protein
MKIVIINQYIPGLWRTLTNKLKLNFKMNDQWDQLVDIDSIIFDPHLIHRFEIHCISVLFREEKLREHARI